MPIWPIHRAAVNITFISGITSIIRLDDAPITVALIPTKEKNVKLLYVAKILARLSAGICCLVFAGSTFADKPRFGDTISLSLGGMAHRGDASLSSTRDDAPVDKLTFKDLGMSDKTKVFWADFTWQFAERWQVSVNYSSFDADGLTTTTRGGNFGGLDWSIGAALSTDFEMELYIVDVTWDVWKTDKAHLGVGLGLHAADLNLDMLLEVGADIGGIGGAVEARSEQASVLAPLPNISLVGGVMVAENVYVGGHMGFFSLKYDKYDGDLFSARGAVEWRPWKNVGFGAAYQYVDIDLAVDSTHSNEFYDMEFYGPILFLSVGF